MIIKRIYLQNIFVKYRIMNCLAIAEEESMFDEDCKSIGLVLSLASSWSSFFPCSRNFAIFETRESFCPRKFLSMYIVLHGRTLPPINPAGISSSSQINKQTCYKWRTFYRK